MRATRYTLHRLSPDFKVHVLLPAPLVGPGVGENAVAVADPLGVHAVHGLEREREKPVLKRPGRGRGRGATHKENVVGRPHLSGVDRAVNAEGPGLVKEAHFRGSEEFGCQRKKGRRARAGSRSRS